MRRIFTAVSLVAVALAAVFALLLLMTGCSPVGTSWPYDSYGPTLTEPGVVVDLAYTRRHINGSNESGKYDTTYTRKLRDYDFLKAVPKR